VNARATIGTPVLQAENVSVTFGGIRALADVSLDVGAEEICGLIGPNGAGKTTFLNAVTCLTPGREGVIRLSGQSIQQSRARDIAALGIARTFQNLGVYGSMTVIDNVLLGAHHALRASHERAILRPLETRAADAQARGRAMEILSELGMERFAEATADALPYPLQKRMEIARALASTPKLLLLDEPAGGLTHSEVDEFAVLIDRLRRSRSLSILLIEHHMGLVMGLCDRIHVFHLGRNLASGTPTEIKSNRSVISAYLGRET
jgi:branched-chain amino acid transport system ATP-binding protein